MSTSEGKCVLVEVVLGALISWSLYSYRIVMLFVCVSGGSGRCVNQLVHIFI